MNDAGADTWDGLLRFKQTIKKLAEFLRIRMVCDDKYSNGRRPIKRCWAKDLVCQLLMMHNTRILACEDPHLGFNLIGLQTSLT